MFYILNNRFFHSHQARMAFTLTELLIVIGITATISVISVGFYINQQKTKLLDTTAEEIVNYLRYAQQKSIAQEGGSQWGIHFENPTSGSDFYALYRGETYSTPEETRYLPTNIEFYLPKTGDFLNVSFSKLTGNNTTSTLQYVVIQLVGSNLGYAIMIEPSGKINSSKATIESTTTTTTTTTTTPISTTTTTTPPETTTTTLAPGIYGYDANCTWVLNGQYRYFDYVMGSYCGVQAYIPFAKIARANTCPYGFSSQCQNLDYTLGNYIICNGEQWYEISSSGFSVIGHATVCYK